MVREKTSPGLCEQIQKRFYREGIVPERTGGLNLLQSDVH